MGDSNIHLKEQTMNDSVDWCNALYFPFGRRRLGGVYCRLESGHDGDHWCDAEDEMAAENAN